MITQDIVGRIIDYENGVMEEEEAILFFQDLVNSGLAWELQGSYGRTAKRLIENGTITLPKREELNAT